MKRTPSVCSSSPSWIAGRGTRTALTAAARTSSGPTARSNRFAGIMQRAGQARRPRGEPEFAYESLESLESGRLQIRLIRVIRRQILRPCVRVFVRRETDVIASGGGERHPRRDARPRLPLLLAHAGGYRRDAPFLEPPRAAR